MKNLLIIVMSFICMSLLIGCSSTGSACLGSCNYDSYTSQCGKYSCTDNYQIIEFSNPCPGSYQCDIDMNWL
jgi:hypothetical protein